MSKLTNELKDAINTNNRIKQSKFLVDFYENRASEMNLLAVEITKQVVVLEQKAEALKKELENSEQVDVFLIEQEIEAIEEAYRNGK